MTTSTRTRSTLVAAATVALLVQPCAASAAARLPARARAAVPRAPVADNGIMPVPLMPIVPTARRVCANRLPSGLGYTVLRPASGAKPAATDTVLVNYLGYLAASGTVFDQNTQAALPVGGVIPGFSQGLQLVARTGVVRLCIPAALGYGAEATGSILANSDLVFQVELLDFKTAAELDAMRKAAGAPAAQADAPTHP